LTASIAHEVNQPLSGIVTNASVCLRSLAGDAPDLQGAREAAQRAIRDANRAAEVIARLRSLFRKKSVVREPFDLNEAIREVLTLATNEVQRSGTVLRAMLAAELPPAVGDRTQIQQVLLNLTLNSLEAMSGIEARRRELIVVTQFSGNDLCVEVRDSGAGLDVQNVERVFDPFFTTKNGGMGMGLAISKSIVESHQGRLWAQRNDGPGASFSFTLPRGSVE
jgi:signal transduction histidine kinase